MAGVAAVKAAACRHPHVANQHGPHAFIVHLIAQALNKLNQIRMTEVATLIGSHHLIAGGVQRQRLGANDTAIGERANRLRAAANWLGYLLPWRGGGLPALASSASRAITVFFMVTSVELSSSRRHSARADA